MNVVISMADTAELRTTMMSGSGRCLLKAPEHEHMEGGLRRHHDEGSIDQLDVPGRVGGEAIEHVGRPPAGRARIEPLGKRGGHP
nr:hypothetical protein [Planobispora takensis]